MFFPFPRWIIETQTADRKTFSDGFSDLRTEVSLAFEIYVALYLYTKQFLIPKTRQAIYV